MSIIHERREIRMTNPSIQLLQALNAAAASLQQSVYSESQVYNAFRDQIRALDLRGWISTLDESGRRLILRTSALPERSAALMAHLEKLTSMRLGIFDVEIDRIEVYSSIIQTGESHYFPDNSLLIEQLLEGTPYRIVQHVLNAIGGVPVIYAPLKREANAIGILNVAGERLTDQDIPAIEAFAKHVAIALDNARLFSKLQEREANYRSLIETSPDAITVIDTQGQIIEVSKQALEVYGYDQPSELLGRDIVELFAPEAREEAIQIYQNIRNNGSLVNQEYLLLRKDGSRFTGEISSAVVRNEYKQPNSIITTARDVTERKRAEAAVLAFHKAFLTIMDSIDADVYTADLNTHEILFLNKHMKETFGENLLGTKCFKAFRDKDQPCENCTNPNLLNENNKPGGMIVWEAQNPITKRWYINRDRAIRWDDGRFVRLQVATDITELKKIQDNLERKTHQQQELIKIARHLAASLDVRDVLEQIALGAKDILNADGCSIYTLDEAGENLTPVVALELPYEDEILSATLDVNNSFTGMAVKARQALLFNNPVETPGGYQIPGTPIEEDEHIIAAPLIADEAVLGAICLDRHGRLFSEEDLALTETYATYAAAALKNAQAHHKLKHEIEERQHAQQQLLHDAFHDGLTDLPNRALFMDRLGRAIQRSKRRKGTLFAILFLDIDRFKIVNDSLGHTIGDQLLKDLANRLEACLRNLDTVARLGGDEFVVLLDALEDFDDPIRIADRIQAEINRPFALNGHNVTITASIGIVTNLENYDNAEVALQDADIAMYRAKSSGRARYEIFDTQMRERAIARLQLELDLRRAIEDQEFCVHYQPLVELESGKIFGFEALLRWQHPEKGMIKPMEFIPVAEETGLLIPIGLWLLQEACHQTRRWQECYPMQPPLSISVNFSSRQLTQPDLVEQIGSILNATGLPATSLRLEVTEDVVMENVHQSMIIMAKLRELGVHIEMDDFGTGYSSLSNLYRLPIENIKIDASFIWRMDTASHNLSIVRTIVSMARELGMGTIAEGVETIEQFEQLRSLNCRFGQGYLFSHPVEGHKVDLLLKEYQTTGRTGPLPQIANA
jgi:diguanylate cyclase (GGDEF)-like protein/PAS domain S-box-containing protein